MQLSTRPSTIFCIVLAAESSNYGSTRSSHQRCSVKKGVSQNPQKITCVRVSFLISCRLRHRCFPVDFAKFLRTSFLQNTSFFCFLDSKTFSEGVCFSVLTVGCKFELVLLRRLDLAVSFSMLTITKESWLWDSLYPRMKVLRWSRCTLGLHLQFLYTFCQIFQRLKDWLINFLSLLVQQLLIYEETQE